MSDSDLSPPPPPNISGNQRGSDGDWTCPDCGNVNFARRNACNRCSKERAPMSAANRKKLGQEIGKAAAEKSRGLFSADDWQCNKCGNVNWARRQQCNVCNAPKFGEVEERTGLGGGYNDRGVVEYRERAESDDDDYDEFGRRKKKRKSDDRDQHDSVDSQCEKEPEKEKKLEPASKKPKEEVEEEEDDEEEDDGDEDLSKYDLSDWGGADDDVKRKSRSRSSSRSPC